MKKIIFILILIFFVVAEESEQNTTINIKPRPIAKTLSGEMFKKLKKAFFIFDHWGIL